MLTVISYRPNGFERDGWGDRDNETDSECDVWWDNNVEYVTDQLSKIYLEDLKKGDGYYDHEITILLNGVECSQYAEEDWESKGYDFIQLIMANAKARAQSIYDAYVQEIKAEKEQRRIARNQELAELERRDDEADFERLRKKLGK